MAADKTVSESLATWIEGLRPGDIPEAARREAENTIIDTIGLSVAALETDYGRAVRKAFDQRGDCTRSEEHTSELQSLMRSSYAVFCLKKKNTNLTQH